MKNEPLHDYTESYAFRAYEAEINEGISLPVIDWLPQDKLPAMSDYLKKVNERLEYLGNRLQQENAKWRYLENKLNEHLDSAKKRGRKNVL